MSKINFTKTALHNLFHEPATRLYPQQPRKYPHMEQQYPYPAAQKYTESFSQPVPSEQEQPKPTDPAAAQGKEQA